MGIKAAWWSVVFFFCMKTEVKKTELVKHRGEGRERSSAKTEKEEEEVASLKESQETVLTVNWPH